MLRKPRDKHAGIFADGVGIDILYQGIVVTTLILIAYFIGLYLDTGSFNIATSEIGISMSCLTMSIVGCCHAINLRSRTESIFKLKTNNAILFLSVAVSILLTICICEVDFIAGVFKLVTLSFEQCAISFLLGFAIIPIVEIVKFIKRKLKKN